MAAATFSDVLASLAQDGDRFHVEPSELTDLPSPRFADTEVTLDELRQRIDATADYLKTFRPEQFDGSDERKISYNAGGAPRQCGSRVDRIIS
jgi:hypothetical protein